MKNVTQHQNLFCFIHDNDYHANAMPGNNKADSPAHQPV
jgi:hypothetical protein